MGQKSNPNSFQQQYTKVSLWSSHNQTDYSVLLKNNFEITQAIHSIFERHGCLIKECTFLRSKEINSSTLFISFLPIRLHRKPIKARVRSISGSTTLANHLFIILAKFGYFFINELSFLI